MNAHPQNILYFLCHQIKLEFFRFFSYTFTNSCQTFLCTGLYGNDDLHNGLLEMLTAGRKVDNLVSSVRNQTNALEHTLTQKIRPQLTELADVFDEPVSNQTALSLLINSLDMVQKNITIATNAAGDIRRPLMGISLNHVLNVSFLFYSIIVLVNDYILKM